LKTNLPEEHKNSIMMRLSCGALAGLFGQTLTYPLDVVKRQMQVFEARLFVWLSLYNHFHYSCDGEMVV